MNYFAPSVETLIDEFSKLPGIGRKTAQRLAFHILNLPKEDADKLAQAITAAKNTIHLCPVCQNLTDEELCPISPLNHVGPDDLSIRELLHRVAEEDIEEVILATNPDTEGEATAMYLARLLKPFHIRVSRLAYGIPVGGQLEYIDEVTLMRALDGRHNIE